MRDHYLDDVVHREVTERRFTWIVGTALALFIAALVQWARAAS